MKNNRAPEAAFKRVGLEMSSHNLRKTSATRLLSREAAITDVQHLLVKTTKKAGTAFIWNERDKQTIDLHDEDTQPELKVVR